jgi:hypothetical protein
VNQNHFGGMPGTDNCTAPDLRIALGAYVLGALDPVENDQVQRHLLECVDCRNEYRDLAAMPGLLATTTETEMASGPMPPGAELLERLLEGAAQRQPPPDRSRRLARRPHRKRRGRVPSRGHVASGGTRRKMLTYGLATAGLVVAAFIGGLKVTGGSGGTPGMASIKSVDHATHVWGVVSYAPAAWGTTINLEMHNVPVGDDCSLVAVDKAGDSAVASTWYAPGAKVATIPGGVSMSASSIAKFEVMDKQGKMLLQFPVPASS